MANDLAREMFGEPGCACPSLKERMVAELEQVELPLCELHQADDIAARQTAADEAKVAEYVQARDAAAAAQRLVEAERQSQTPQPAPLPLNGDPLLRDLHHKLGVPMPAQDKPTEEKNET